MDIETLKDIAEQAEAPAREARDRYNAALIEAHPIKVGMVMVAPGRTTFRHMGGGAPKRVQVSRVTVKWGKVTLYGRAFKKDGALGALETELHSFREWKVESTPVGS